MKESIHFVYDGISSEDMGLINVQIDAGLYEEPFLASKDIREVKIRGKDKPYFLGVNREPLTFELSFAFKNKWDDILIRSVANWLHTDYYKEFYTLENPERKFFCMPNGDITLIHNGLKRGYVQFEMRCDSAYTYSAEIDTGILDFSTNTVEGTRYIFNNEGDRILKPELWIAKIGDGDVSIENETTNEIFEITNLYDGETVYFDNEREEIESDVPALYRFDDFNDNYLELATGENTLLVKGICTLRFRYRFETLT